VNAYKDGLMAPYVAVCLFGGLRPTEAARLDWSQVNLDDGEILLAQEQTKTGKSRVVKICRRWRRASRRTKASPSIRLIGERDSRRSKPGPD